MTPRISALTDQQSPAASAEVLAATKAKLGVVPNLHRTLAHAPAALKAYADMSAALAGGTLHPKLRESIAVATAGANGCTYCASAHTYIGTALRIPADELTRNLHGESGDPRTAAALSFVGELIDRRGAVSDASFAAVRDAGFTDAEIVEIVAHVALNGFARTEVDFPRVELTNARG